MSTLNSSHNCQELQTLLRRDLAPFSDSLQPKLNNAQPVALTLRPPQLALAAAFFSHTLPNQAVVLAFPVKKCRDWLRLVVAWQEVFAHPQQWHLLTGELTPQESAGHVTTQLSYALHCLLGEMPNHHYVVPEDALTTLVPTARDYQQQRADIHVGEKVSLRDLVDHLVEQGYTRFTTSLEPGGIRIRGEQLDIYHPTFPGPYTVTLYGKTIESIVGHRGRRSTTVPTLAIPPMKFPASTVSLTNSLAPTVIYRPHHAPLAHVPAIIYDALAADLVFPFEVPGDEQEKNLPRQTVVLYENWERITHYLAAHPLPNPSYCRSALAHHAISLYSPTVAVVSEATLLPAPAAARPISYQQGVALIANLREGKAAVHVDHGIGIYEGLQSRTIGTLTRDYLILRYTAGDTLSVPVEFAHKVTAYLGEALPKLNSLGGATWAAARKKAKYDAEKFARTLLTTAQARAGRSRDPYYLDPAVEATLEESFPYLLTPDQEATWQAVQYDLQQIHPMDRLIVGDVGFGKTEVAIRAACHVAHNGKQVAVLAPTTLLVQQHADTFMRRLPQWRSHIAVLSRFTPPAVQKKERARIAAGKVRIVIGTHALLSKAVTWHALGCVIIDEEQRFGVQHKEYFKKMRSSIDVLSLSATPIPRTLSMALSGLKELSIISTPPEGRKSVATHVGQQNDEVMAQAIQRELARGGQTYVVAPRIRGLAAWSQSLARLLPGARIATVHGQLENKQLAALMQQFDTGNIDVLISSTIIENGLDVPNANTLIVLHATHFGLSELYQLRGRIGRRQRQGYAFFLYDQQELTSIQRQRLTALTEAARLGSGWTLAQRDLEIRGAGNLLGAEQSGTVNAIGVQLYLDMVHQAIGGGDRLTHREVDIHLPLSAAIPATYVADVAARTHYYQLLSRAGSLEQLAAQRHDMENYFGPFPEETNTLYQLLELQHAAATAGITHISSQTITPTDEAPYARLIIDGKKLPEILSRVHSLGNWVVRDSTLALDVAAITPVLAQRLLVALQK